ncbi:M48 family metallopeptidase [Winogradskyella sp.]|uniref:M48 family metallopeptidase n=1 Tax=Winogradskyella sp. TaxID=1883156 RepID=UPI003BA9CBE3
MKYSIISLFLMLIALDGFGQEIGDFNLEDMIKEYKMSLDDIGEFNGCGHVLDGPLYIMKTLENKSLDAAIQFNNFDTDKVGEEVYQQIIETNTVLDDHWAKDEIANVVKKLTEQLDPEHKKEFKLKILDSEVVNAYTTYGGYIYLTSGLIDFVDSYDELAFIIAHEIAHDINLHTQRKIIKLLLTSNLLDEMNLNTIRDVVVGLNTKYTAPFDQIDEYEADKHGAILAHKAGYDSSKFADFFKKMEKYDDKTILKKVSSTHPFSEDRINCLETYIAD